MKKLLLILFVFGSLFSSAQFTRPKPYKDQKKVDSLAVGDSVITMAAIARYQQGGSGGGANALGTYIVQTATNAPANAQILGSLGTGIVKNTTTTGVLSIASAGDFPTLNQSTTGSAATLTNTRTIWGQSFDGSGNVTGNITLGTSSITMTGSLAATGARVTKGWFTDIESTNMPTVGGTSLSSTFSPIAGSASITTVGTLSAGSIPATLLTGSVATARLTNLKQFRSMTIVAPVSSENATLFYTTEAITITQVRGVMIGSSQSVTLVVNYGASRATADGTIVASNTFDSGDTGYQTTGFAFTLNTTSIPAGSYIWVTTSATSGTINDFNLTVTYNVQ